MRNAGIGVLMIESGDASMTVVPRRLVRRVRSQTLTPAYVSFETMLAI